MVRWFSRHDTREKCNCHVKEAKIAHSKFLEKLLNRLYTERWIQSKLGNTVFFVVDNYYQQIFVCTFNAQLLNYL